MTDLPSGWTRVRLDEVAEVRLGRQRSPKNHTGDNMRPYLRAANVDWNGLKLDDVKSMNFTDEEAEIYRLRPGDIVLGEASGSPGEVGKPAIWNGEIEDCCIQNTLLRVRSHGPDPKYLLYFLRFEAVRGAFVEHSRGVGIHHIGAERLSSWMVPLPPLAEQRRIAAALEGHLPRLRVALEQTRNIGRRLASWEAVIGGAILAGVRSKIGLVVEDGVKGWGEAAIGDLAMVGTGATPLRSRKDFYEGGTVPWVTSGLLSEPFVDQSAECITEIAVAETSVKVWPPGTLLVAMYGEGRTRGRCSELRIAAATNQACAAVRLKPEWDSYRSWVKLFFQAAYEQNRRLASGGVQPNLNLGLIRNLRVPMPPAPERDRLLEEFAAQSGIALRLRTAIRLAYSRGGNLRKSLMSEAFAGRLVSQDPNDEPASELLARIRAERAAVPPKKKTRSRRTQKELAAPPTRVTGDDYQQEALPL
ncbi:restriction endonuclease subunit S [Micromonospora zamorensis]|uniref:restriction endonuclease subunit S n=1 Tax=Micromonospora zamorensis TaxID=709883 RepID=UPI003795499B